VLKVINNRAHLVTGYQATAHHEGAAWVWGIFKFCPLNVALMCTFHTALHSQLA